MWGNRLGVGRWFYWWGWLVAELLAFRSCGGCHVEFQSGIGYLRVQLLAAAQTSIQCSVHWWQWVLPIRSVPSMILKCSRPVCSASQQFYEPLSVFLGHFWPKLTNRLLLFAAYKILTSTASKATKLFLRSVPDLCEQRNWCTFEVSRTSWHWVYEGSMALLYEGAGVVSVTLIN